MPIEIKNGPKQRGKCSYASCFDRKINLFDQTELKLPKLSEVLANFFSVLVALTDTNSFEI